jgi:hypothetical protein
MSLERIIIHHTAGEYIPNADDLEHYHFMIDGYGNLHAGKHKPEDNEDCTHGIGTYAAHVGGLNTGSIGIAICGNLGFDSNTSNAETPIKPIQVEHICHLAAQLCKQYNIPITPETIRTHYEVGQYAQTLKEPGLLTQDIGKVDIIFVPNDSTLKHEDVGNYLRMKIKWYFDSLK